jgi:1,2-phenylacetyl-CoA epoxidase catalytic subunit
MSQVNKQNRRFVSGRADKLVWESAKQMFDEDCSSTEVQKKLKISPSLVSKIKKRWKAKECRPMKQGTIFQIFRRKHVFFQRKKKGTL